MKLKKSAGGVNLRRVGAKNRLKLTLAKNETALKALEDLDVEKQQVDHMDRVVRMEREIVRIKNELDVLTNRIVSQDAAVQIKKKKYRAVR